MSDVDAELTTVEKKRRVIEKVASDVDIPEIFRNGSPEPVVEFCKDCSNHHPGQNSSQYEDARERYGPHLVFNAFWMISNFWLHQMHIHYGNPIMGCMELDAIDLGIIITLIRAILRAFLEIVESDPYIQGSAAAK